MIILERIVTSALFALLFEALFVFAIGSSNAPVPDYVVYTGFIIGFVGFSIAAIVSVLRGETP